ncbi:MAG: ABC transporter permease [Clostridia bacterium]|nr:ABC transporter permease [Clostridia bacterium]
MKAFIRHILRSAESEKGQVAVIIITIAIVTAMVFVAFSMYDVFFNLNMAEYDRVAEGADMLLGDNFGGGGVFSKARLDRVLNAQPEGEIKDITYFAKTPSILKTKTESKSVLVEATDLEEYIGNHQIKYVEIFDENTPSPDIPYLESAGYSSVIVGENFALESNIKAGDMVEVYLPTYGMYTTLIVRAVALNEGIFGSTADMNILVDFEAIGNQGQINAVYINFTDDAYFEKYEELFATYFPAVECGEGNGYSEVVSIVTNNTLLFSIALIFLIATLMLILFTAYLIVSRNRMSEMIIFKSAGATPMQVAFIMLSEVLFYSLVGGAVGLMLGRIAMGVVSTSLLPMAPHAVTYPVWKFIVSYVISIVVSVLSTLVPIIQVSKKTVRELSSNGFKVSKAVKPLTLIISSIIVVGISIAYAFLSGIALLVMSVALIIAIAFWIYCAIHFVTKLIGTLVKKISKGGATYIAGISVTRSSAMQTVTTLIAVVIAFSFLITQVVGIVKDATIPFRERYSADYVVLSQSGVEIADFDTIKGTALEIDSIDGAGWFSTVDYYLPDGENDFTVYGVNDYWTLEHCTTGLDSEVKSRWQNTDNPIVLNQNIVMMLDVEIGDEVTFSPVHEDFKSEKHTFTLVGIDKSISQWDMVAYCNHSFTYRMTNRANFLITADGTQTADTFVELRDAIEGLELPSTFALTYDEWAYAEQESFQGVGPLMTLLQVLVWLISLMGVANIAIVTVYDRRAEYRLYKLSGMSSSDYIKFSFGEGVVSGLSGGILGFIAGYAVNMLVPSLGSIIQRYKGFAIMPLELVITFLIGVGAFLLLWMLIALVNRKNTIKSINERNLNT